ncbi:MAG: TonB-dependent receptor family protein [Crocinitomicaceae bacterium]|nr:TonB-dependent receptor family protein [Crocinitomicaceae bacterium]
MKYFFFLFLTISLNNSFSQENLTITGKVIDVNKQPLAYVTVQYTSSQDSTLIGGEITDEDGKFSLKIPTGKYSITFRLTGLFADTIHIKESDKEKIDLGVIQMRAIASLENIEIVGQQSTMEFQLDKRVFNVGTDLNNQGANATQILENIPSVTVDADGNVSLRGNSNVRILIDGKLSGFTSSAEALQQLQGDNIEKIEVITNASARYDAEGEAGIINIILKKNKTKGFNGTVALKGGYFPLIGGDIRLNYKKGKVNFYTTYSINYAHNPGYSTTYQSLTNKDTSFTYIQNYRQLEKGLNHYATVGFDYDINEFNTLSASIGIKSNNNGSNYYRLYENLDNNDSLFGYSNRLEYQKRYTDMLEAALSYNKSFKNKAQWDTSIKWFNNQNITKSDYTESFSDSSSENLQFSQINTDEQNLTAQTDFSLPFAKTGKFETGGRTQFRQMINQIQFGDWNGINWDYPSIYNDRYNYDEAVYAAYAMASNTWNKFSLQVGVRAEFTQITTLQKSNFFKNKQSFIDLFPSAAISYKTTKNQTLQLSYSRRISRPGQWNLMPYMRFGDNRERMVGNPYLKPEYTNSLEAGILQNWKSGTFLGTIYYRFTSNKIERITSFAADEIIYITPYNIAFKNAIGAEFNITYTPINWLRLNTGFNFYNEEIKGQFDTIHIQRSNFTWTNRSSISFSFPKIIKAQIAFNYQAPSVRAQGKSLAVYYFDLGFSRDLFKGNATIALNIRDLLNTRAWRSMTNTPEIYSRTEGHWRQRSIVLVFTYRFNQTKKNTAKNDFNIIDERDSFQE